MLFVEVEGIVIVTVIVLLMGGLFFCFFNNIRYYKPSCLFCFMKMINH